MSEAIFESWDIWAVRIASALPLIATIAGLLRRPITREMVLTLATQLIVLVALPWIYLEARSRHDLRQLQGLLEQSRWGEAQALSNRVLRFDRTPEVKGVPLPRLAAEIDRIVQGLRSRVAAPLPGDADSPARIARAQDLAMLGRTREALAVLDSSASLDHLPAACNLRGTIHETRREWRQSLHWYGRGKAAWQLQDESSPERTTGVIQAATGIGYAQRKLGRYQQAEAAYQEVLALAPTADSHFLLARFYEDAQQAAKAQMHARAAMALAPQQYTQAGQELIDKLITLHFGCWGVRSAEQRSLETSAATP